MRSNKGITLTSLVIYVIGLTVVIAAMGTFNGYFYRNTKVLTLHQGENEQYSKFLSYITKDVNSSNLEFVTTGVAGNDCIIFKFTNGIEHQYIVQNREIYYINVEDQNDKKIVLCENVSALQNSVFDYQDNKISINFKIGDTNFGTELNVNI